MPERLKVLLRPVVLAILICTLATAFPVPTANAQNRIQRVLVHYMPWYASKAVSGRWGWHWTMNHFDPDVIQANGRRQAASHLTPRIGLYDSNDPHVLECQVLLMKLAGIHGVIIDWYGTEKFRDYGDIHRNSQHLVKYVKKAGLQFAVCYEDQTVKHMIDNGMLAKRDAVAQGKKTFKWLSENWFNDDAYVFLNGRPVVLVFGPQYFSREQWEQITSDLAPRPWLYGLPHLVESRGMDGAFGWPPVSGGRTIAPEDWRKYLQALYARPAAERDAAAVAFPAFHDIYQQAKLHASYGYIDDRDGKTFVETYRLARQSRVPLLQIATWNDYGEGTVIEPTEEFGFRYLKHIQRNVVPEPTYRPADLELPISLYQLKKKYDADRTKDRQLQLATDLLFAGKCDQATEVIRAINDRR